MKIQAERFVLGVLSLACVLSVGCASYPSTYDGDYSEFFAAQAAQQEARAQEQGDSSNATDPAQQAAPDAGESGESARVVPLIPVATPDRDIVVRTDPEIARDVRNALSAEPLLSERKLAVRVQGGLVTLEGAVRNFGEASAAVLAATRVEGVRGVYDLIELYQRQEAGAEVVLDSGHVFSSESDWRELRKLAWSDHDVQRAIVAYFDRTPEIDAIDVEVSVEDGLVVLRGRVDTASERSAAEAVAKHVGRRKVRNEIEVRPVHDPARPRKVRPF